MTQEEDLLFKDLCGRIPYGVKVNVSGWDEENQEEVLIPLKVYSVDTDGYVRFENNDYNVDYCGIEHCTLFLRPMRSMTKEERDEYIRMLCGVGFTEFHKTADKILDFLYKRHFDVHGLIPKGMAIEVTPENNPYKV